MSQVGVFVWCRPPTKYTQSISKLAGHDIISNIFELNVVSFLKLLEGLQTKSSPRSALHLILARWSSEEVLCVVASC